jgi:hypothetical protein
MCYSEHMDETTAGAVLAVAVLVGCVLKDTPRWISAFYNSLRSRRAHASVGDSEVPEKFVH